MKDFAACSIAALWLLSGPVSAQADEARAKKIVLGVCFLCHGAEGEASSESHPRLAGQHWEYIARQLENFKSGKRKSTAMRDLAAALKPDEMVAIGKYFERMSVPAQPANNAGLAAAGRQLFDAGDPSRGLPACAECHGADALGTAALPRLAGQYARYIEAQLRSFGNRERTTDNALMHDVASRMTRDEMIAVAEYLSGK